MNPVEKTIREKGLDESSVFVFPSEIAARLWLDAALRILGAETLESSRFIAWDRFKEDAVKAGLRDRRPVSSVVRRLYATDLARRNSDSGLFTSLIPPDYADSGAVFAPWISKLLPSLPLWERQTAKYSKDALDEEDRDLAALKDDYSKFLDREGLFEPAWQRPPLKDTGLRYYIFFPEVIEDWDEYASLILGSGFIVPLVFGALQDISPAGEPRVSVYETTREELRSLALEIEKLVSDGLEPREIAVSVPDLETVAPYLRREFDIRGIPYNFRAGSALGELPAGRLFSLIGGCVGTGFSFSALKALLLNRMVPWSHPEMAEGLIEFGIRNHCVTGWAEDGRRIDVWEEAFKTPVRHETPDWRLRDWYRALRQALEWMTEAKTFSDIRSRYFSFREKFLDITLLSPDDDAVLARCIEELGSLIETERELPTLIPRSPWSFFVSTIAEVLYVPRAGTGGVSVFPYRVAAGTPFSRHFVIDASQNRATVLYRQLSFLRQDKRVRRNIGNKDASGAFFGIYRLCGADFSVSRRSFAGYSTPHGFFRETPPREPDTGDPFAGERRFFASGSDGKPLPDRIYPTQASGYARWLERNDPPGHSYLSRPYGERVPPLTERIRDRHMTGDNVKVSATDLRDFSVCNARWFLSRVLGLAPLTRDAELMNERNLGILYHSILSALYSKISKIDKGFIPEHSEQYHEWARELAQEAASEHAEFRGPLAAPLISSLVNRIVDGISGVIDMDSERLAGYDPAMLEKKLSLARDGIEYKGTIDRISRNPADEALTLIDYKSGSCPKAADYQAQFDADGELIVQMADFQIPMYVLLAEQSPESPYHGKKIEEAWFASIRERRFRPVVNDKANFNFVRAKTILREDFESSIKALTLMAESYADAVRQADFTRPAGLPRAECAACDFLKVCRYLYAVGGRR